MRGRDETHTPALGGACAHAHILDAEIYPQLEREKTMSPEERQLLAGLFDRVRTAAANPRDREAEAFIDDSVRAQPYAPYLLAQTVIVQEQALRAANDRLKELESKVEELQQSKPAGSGGFLSGLSLGGLFGGGQQPAPAPRPMGPPPGGPWQQPQAYGGGQSYSGQQPYGAPPAAGPWGGQPQSGGGSFLHGALGAAAGVAGGVLLADSIRGLFNHNSMGIGSGFGGSGLGGGLGGETVVNNYYGSDQGSSGQDALQDQDQDQDASQDAGDFGGGDFASNDDSGGLDV